MSNADEPRDEPGAPDNDAARSDAPRSDAPRENVRPSVFAQARQLLDGMVRLARLEILRGRQELGEMLAEARIGVVLVAVGVVLVIFGLITLDVALILGIASLFEVVPDLAVVIIIVATFTALVVLYVALGAGQVLSSSLAVPIALLVVVAALAVPAYFGFSPPWMAALFVLFVELALAGLAVARGVQHFNIGAPEETIASVKEDIAWAKRLLKRG